MLLTFWDVCVSNRTDLLPFDKTLLVSLSPCGLNDPLNILLFYWLVLWFGVRGWHRSHNKEKTETVFMRPSKLAQGFLCRELLASFVNNEAEMTPAASFY